MLASLKNDKAQMSLDLLIALSIFMLSVSAAIYYTVSTFIPYSDNTLILQSCAYRVAMILAENSGIYVSNRTILTNWQTALENGSVKNITLVGLAQKAPVKSSYDTSIPCCLNKTKVLDFFNKTLWKDVYGNNYLENLSNLIGLGMYERYGKCTAKVKIYYNISLDYMNGTVVTLNGVIKCQIGYPRPISGDVAKFERIVVIYNESKENFTAKDFRRLVVYVW